MKEEEEAGEDVVNKAKMNVVKESHERQTNARSDSSDQEQEIDGFVHTNVRKSLEKASHV